MAGLTCKTTLVKEIANKGAKHMFDEIVMVEISEVPSMERIQNQIAEQLGLHFDVDSVEQRARRLYNKMIMVKSKEGRRADDKRSKILIILDNIWEKLDLSKVGIPKSDENTEKILL
ncbi:disease resistance protein At4g27190-like [Chenopodium quinoa]|uniref:disease resistance protein At4g27190-like n=1 Tax=Chenopodium quinoa TaxID=63459 RepID=UPI000B77806D|nr:disease resistance protein At4g27190-like [Chenopodium quinoa]